MCPINRGQIAIIPKQHTHFNQNSKFTQNKIKQNIQRVLFSPLFPPLTDRPFFSNQPEADVTGTRADDATGRELLVALVVGVSVG